ncbi:MAG: hypothetical protein QF467_05075, partial [SAR202 cluster bacterium]|nr:hypothetical protein [SAR202 cluster bacterium]
MGRIPRRRNWADNDQDTSTPPYEFTVNYPYLKALLQAFTVAKSFIHFVSFGSLSGFMAGVLKLAAQRVPVNGVISVTGSNVASVLKSATQYNDEAARLDLRVLASEGSSVDLPHQKLVVIDGLLSSEGSANLNEQAWRKAEQDL